MSAGDGAGRRKTAEELLRQLLTEPEHMAVLDYAREHALERDSAVFFLVAMLKMFAFAYDRMLGAIEIAEAGTDGLLAATRQSSTRIDKILTDNRKVFEDVLSQHLTRLGCEVAELNAAMGAIRVVKEELEKTAQEAKGVHQFYRRLTGEGVAGSLSQQFQRAVIRAHEDAMPDYRKRLSDLIGLEGGWFKALAALMTIEILILGIVILRWN